MKTREYMMDTLENAWGVRFTNTTERFNGAEGGIWLSAENGETDPLDGGQRLFDYWSFGVHKRLDRWVEENGWYFEWNDPGTIMLWPSN